MTQHQNQVKKEEDLFIITCSLHKKDPLAQKSPRCYCKILIGVEAKEARTRSKIRTYWNSHSIIPFNGPEFIKSVFYYHSADEGI